MVKKTAQGARPIKQGELICIRTPEPCLEALEERLEAGFMLPQALARAAGGHAFSGDAGETCACQGTLCQCDGLDCVGVCELHCIVDYA